MFIGEYGEAFTYEMEWVLHPPVLKNGIEVVRFHSMLTNPPDKVQVKDSDFVAENFTRLNLVELIVMPKTGAQFKNLGELRSAKAAALTSKGAVFHIAPMGDGKWPESTFAVTVSSPYALYQRYAETEEQIFILTTGLKGLDLDSYTAADDFVGAVGDFFYRLQPPSKTFERPNLGDMKRLSFPLLVVGLILLSMPWARTSLYPLGVAAVTASIMSSVLKLGAFYGGRWLDVIGHGALASPGPIGWAAIPLFAAAIFFRARKLSRARWWFVIVCAVVATAILVLLGAGVHDAVISGDESTAHAFSGYMFGVGLFYGACLGLTASRRSMAGSSPALLVLLTLCLSPQASAQGVTHADRLEGNSPHRFEQIQADLRADASDARTAEDARPE
jgi:hypothetical protein